MWKNQDCNSEVDIVDDFSMLGDEEAGEDDEEAGAGDEQADVVMKMEAVVMS